MVVNCNTVLFEFGALHATHRVEFDDLCKCHVKIWWVSRAVLYGAHTQTHSRVLLQLCKLKALCTVKGLTVEVLNW